MTPSPCPAMREGGESSIRARSGFACHDVKHAQIIILWELKEDVGLTPPKDWFSDQTIHLLFLFVVKK